MSPYTISFLILFVVAVLIALGVVRWLRPALQALLEDVIGNSAVNEYYLRALYWRSSLSFWLRLLSRPSISRIRFIRSSSLGSHPRTERRLREPDGCHIGVCGAHHDRGGYIETPFMSNETYLAVSYSAFGLLALLMAAFVYAVLRSSFRAIADPMTKTRGQFLKRVMPVFLMLMASAGFFSVGYNYKSCATFSYDQVVKDRDYLIKTNREQVKETSGALSAGVLLWTAIATVCVVTTRKSRS